MDGSGEKRRKRAGMNGRQKKHQWLARARTRRDARLRQRDNKKTQRERSLVREFLRHAGFPFRDRGFRSVETVPGPDWTGTCLVDGHWQRIGIEVTEYQTDATFKGSPGRMRDGLFQAVWRHLEPLLAGHPPARHYFGSIYFDRRNPLRQRDAKALAYELFAFVTDHVDAIPTKGLRAFGRTGQYPWDPGDFDRYPLLKAHVDKLWVFPVSAIAQAYLWSYSNAACVGVVPPVVMRLLSDKAAKVSGYDTRNTAELWLLICAGVAVPTDSAGPQACAKDLICPKISSAARSSGFDRVFFWERAHGWDLRLDEAPSSA